MIILNLVILVLVGVFIYFAVGMLLDKDISGLKVMLLGVHISILGLLMALSMTTTGFMIAIVGFMTSLISFILDGKKD